jgi:hypothetical protein
LLSGFQLSDRNYVSDKSKVYTEGHDLGNGPITIEFSSANYVSAKGRVYTQGLDFGDGPITIEFGQAYVKDGSRVYYRSAIEYLSALPVVPGDTGQVIVFGFTMDFKGVPRRIDIGDIVSFESFVYGPKILQYTWRFGDGATSNKINPKHQYTKPGYYDVWLTCRDETGQVITLKKRNYIFVNDYGLDFIGKPTSGRAMLKVKFEVIFKPL